MIDERGNDWRSDAPNGTEIYCWFMADDNPSDEPILLYLGLGSDGTEFDRGAWESRGAQPVPLSELSGRFLHPAIGIPYCRPTAEAVAAAEENLRRQVRQRVHQRKWPWHRRFSEWWVDTFGARFPNRDCD
jgi:hypothetical protein